MKDAYYFSHDSNAQQDPKIIRLIMDMKMNGYGIFWSVVEHLRNDTDYKLNLSDCNAIAFNSHCDIKDVERVIKDFGLFEVDENGFFWSKSLMERMIALDAKRDKARASANSRWHSGANALRTQSDGNASKVNTVHKVKEVNNEDFLESLKTNPAYKHISLETELGRMDAWLYAHPGRKKTKRFVLAWLNKVEQPLPVLKIASKPFPTDKFFK